MSRLTILHINIIGAVVCVIAGVAFYFLLITSGNEKVTKSEAALKAVEAREQQFNTAQKALEKAKADRSSAIADYQVFEAQYMPTIGYPAIDQPSAARLKLMMRLFWPNNGRSWPERFIKLVRGHMAREQKVDGIVWENPGVVVLPAYGPDPNTIEAAQTGEGLGPVLHYHYQMSVRARNLDALMRHLRAWTSAKWMGVPTVDGLQITGNSPDLRASYILTLTIILHDDEAKRIPPQNGRISGSSGSGSGGGMGGPMGMGGGMTGPMGMMGPGAMMPPGAGRGGPSSMPMMGTGGAMAPSGGGGGSSSSVSAPVGN